MATLTVALYVSTDFSKPAVPVLPATKVPNELDGAIVRPIRKGAKVPLVKRGGARIPYLPRLFAPLRAVDTALQILELLEHPLAVPKDPATGVTRGGYRLYYCNTQDAPISHGRDGAAGQCETTQFFICLNNQNGGYTPLNNLNWDNGRGKWLGFPHSTNPSGLNMRGFACYDLASPVHTQPAIITRPRYFTIPDPAVGPPVVPEPQLDPNVRRRLGPSPQPMPEPAYAEPPLGEPPPRARVIDIVLEPKLDLTPVTQNKPPSPTRPVTPTAPPEPGTKERKVLSRVARMGIAVAGALDKASEAAEVVEAAYNNLPADVQKRYGCKKSSAAKDFGLGGQYAQGDSACMATAVYHNWHKLDMNGFILDLIDNWGKDKLYGAAYGARDKMTRPRHWKRQWKQ